MSTSYAEAGVDLRLAGEVTARITQRLGSGLFGGFLPVSQLKSYREPVLVSSIDGVGTKVRLARRLGAVDGLGRDIVHHCVNDIAVHGAEPLFFLDYLAFDRLDPAAVDGIVRSIADACRDLGIRLSGGETAEMPALRPGQLDIAGAIVGVVEADAIVDGSTIRTETPSSPSRPPASTPTATRWFRRCSTPTTMPAMSRPWTAPSALRSWSRTAAI